MKILIPMAGEGSRFKKEGYKLPKPLVDVKGKPMIQRVIENLPFDSEFIFLIRKEHLKKNKNILNILSSATKNKYKYIVVDSLTEGAACTALLAKELINTNESLLIANSDQYMEWLPENFKLLKNFGNTDAIVFSFNDTDPKWSFVKTNEKGLVIEVAEKKPISNIATCGIYWYRKGSDFVKYAEQMIQKNIRVNNEFYIAPVYNELIKDNKKLIPFYVEKMHGMGTPKDLNEFLKKNINLP